MATHASVKPAPAARPATAKTAGAPTPPATPGPAAGAKVRATRDGYYNHKRRRAGDVFRLTTPESFSATWMEPVPAATPEKVSTSRQHLQRQHDETLGGKVTKKGLED